MCSMIVLVLQRLKESLNYGMGRQSLTLLSFHLQCRSGRWGDQSLIIGSKSVKGAERCSVGSSMLTQLTKARNGICHWVTQVMSNLSVINRNTTKTPLLIESQTEESNSSPNAVIMWGTNESRRTVGRCQRTWISICIREGGEVVIRMLESLTYPKPNMKHNGLLSIRICGQHIILLNRNAH